MPPRPTLAYNPASQRSRMMRFVALASALLLAACATTTQPGVEVRTVRIPVPKECVPKDQIPAEPATVADSLNGNAAADLPIVAASALLLRAWGREMHAALGACADDGAPPTN